MTAATTTSSRRRNMMSSSSKSALLLAITITLAHTTGALPTTTTALRSSTSNKGSSSTTYSSSTRFLQDEKPVVNVIEVIVPNNTTESTAAAAGGGGKFEWRKDRGVVDVRYNKCPPVLEEGTDRPMYACRHTASREYTNCKNVYPLMPMDYPLTVERADMLRRETMSDSVILPGDFQLFGATAEDWMAKVKAPSYPSGDPNAPYWEELRHVVRVQIARRNGNDPITLSRWPDLWSDYDLEDIAKAVDREYPASLQQELIKQVFASGGVKMDKSMLEFRSVVDFVGTQVRIAALNTWAFEAVGPINFLLKWHVGMPRPEEMAILIGSGHYGTDDGVPQDIVDDLIGMDLQNATHFTAYMQGSPTHPSWPAMHAAGSSCSYWLPVIAEITPEQYCEALRLDYGVAYARTVAGVHYPMDNYAGLNIGLQIIRETMAGHLAKSYGYNETSVQTKLDALAFDWETFDPYNCTIAGVPVADRLVV